MPSIIGNLFFKINGIFAGQKCCQGFYQFLHTISLQGMNVGMGSLVESSGERYVIKYIKDAQGGNSSITVFDVGANVGDFAYTVQNILGQSATIFCFEPKKSTFDALKMRFSDVENPKLFNFGFGNKQETVTLYFDRDPEKSGLASVYPRNLDHFGIYLKEQETIQLTTIDTFCQENDINNINFLKMDVEGHEISVLNGAKRMINADAITNILFEFGGCNIDSRTFFQDFYYLLKDKYHIYRVLQDGLFPISEYREIYEIFLTTNFLAVHKQ